MCPDFEHLNICETFSERRELYFILYLLLSLKKVPFFWSRWKRKWRLCIDWFVASLLLLVLFVTSLTSYETSTYLSYSTSSFSLQMSSSTTFSNLAEQISRIEPPHLHDWIPYSASDGMLVNGSAIGHHLYSASEDDEDEDDAVEALVRVRPRTGSLSEHEDLLALKAEAQAAIRHQEAGYDVRYCVLIYYKLFFLLSCWLRSQVLKSSAQRETGDQIWITEPIRSNCCFCFLFFWWEWKENWSTQTVETEILLWDIYPWLLLSGPDIAILTSL